MSEKHFERFLQDVAAVRGTRGGTAETAYYPALSNLFNDIGKGLKPRVRAVITLKSMGAGLPDGGFFTPDQFDRESGDVRTPLAPSRGVLEVKAPSEAIEGTAAGKQVAKYWDRYKLVLLTNMRDWMLLGEREGQRVTLERFQLASTEADFWAMAMKPAASDAEFGPAFHDFIARALRHAAPLSDPKDLAWFLASYARDARYRVERAEAVGANQLVALKESLEGALGVSFQDGMGNRFFQSTLVQTLFYGLFAAWVLKHREGKEGRFEWKTAIWYLRVPMIDALYAQLAQPNRLKALYLEEVLDWAADALNRVDQASFFTKFEANHSVQYFYEPFLQEFDPQLRKELGVWYTPEEIVRYMVARVDDALEHELGLVDGLADSNVVVVDPCCGTGAYLVEVLRRISERLKAKGEDALVAHDLKTAAMSRLFGFELLPAPFVIAHLQLGLLLHDLGAPLSANEGGVEDRAGVYLTNALTGWQPLKDPKSKLLPFPEFDQEREAADSVKQTQRILVILGNPPYNGFAGVAAGEERDLTEAYRHAKTGPQPQGRGLNELYVRFYRMAERQIAEKTGRGIVCYISNYSWLDGLSHPAMRERFLEKFDLIRVDNLQGDKYSTGKTTPTGEPDPSAFSTSQNREGIQVGTAIATLVRKGDGTREASLVEREWWGRTKLADLAAASNDLAGLEYRKLEPELSLGRAFGGRQTSALYLSWPSLIDLFPASYSGVCTKRDESLVDISRDALVERMKSYLDPNIAADDVRAIVPNLMKDANRFDHLQVRSTLLLKGFVADQTVRYLYRPFDPRWVYWEPTTKLLGEKSPDYRPKIFDGNYWIITTGRTRKELPEPAYATSLLTDLNFLDSGARAIPLKIQYSKDDLLGNTRHEHFNLSEASVVYLNDLKAEPQLLLWHALAITHSPAYRDDNNSALRHGWPRIPLPSCLETLTKSAALGQRVAALMDVSTPVPGVTGGTLLPMYAAIGTITRMGGGALRGEEFALTAGWGSAGKGGITMPGRGKVTAREFQPDETVAADALGATSTTDVWLNDHAYWKNIPLPVWDYTVGGYQAIKKWLSYREQTLLGRRLTASEVRDLTGIARRIAALVTMQPELDQIYQTLAEELSPATSDAK